MNRLLSKVFALWLAMIIGNNCYLGAKVVATDTYQFKELFTIGVDDEVEKELQPYCMSKLIGADCDSNGNIYALDYYDVCVKQFDKNGGFLKRLFRKGKGPEELSNCAAITINPYNNHIFILQDYGFTLKEFGPKGQFLATHSMPKQCFIQFRFIGEDRCICTNAVPSKDKYDNFHIFDINEKKIVRGIASSNVPHEYNHKQHFCMSGDSILWTSCGDKMTLLGYDLKDGEKTREISIPGKYSENKLKKIIIDKDSSMVRPILFNIAQPFIIDSQLFVLVAMNNYFGHDGKIQKFPVSYTRIIFHVKGSQLIKLGGISGADGMYIATTWKNRLLLYSNEPFARIKILEFTKK